MTARVYSLLDQFLFSTHGGDREYAHCRVLSPGGRRVELTESPASKNLHVYVDGVRYQAVK